MALAEPSRTMGWLAVPLFEALNTPWYVPSARTMRSPGWASASAVRSWLAVLTDTVRTAAFTSPVSRGVRSSAAPPQPISRHSGAERGRWERRTYMGFLELGIPDNTRNPWRKPHDVVDLCPALGCLRGGHGHSRQGGRGRRALHARHGPAHGGDSRLRLGHRLRPGGAPRPALAQPQDAPLPRALRRGHRPVLARLLPGAPARARLPGGAHRQAQPRADRAPRRALPQGALELAARSRGVPHGSGLPTDPEMRGGLMYSRVRALGQWLALGSVVGVVCGGASALFLFLLDEATHWRLQHESIVYLLPVAGLVIGALYGKWGASIRAGNNLVIDTAHEGDARLPLRMAPMVLIGTVLTHLFGGDR